MIDSLIKTDSNGTFEALVTGTGLRLKAGGIAFDNTAPVAGKITGATATTLTLTNDLVYSASTQRGLRMGALALTGAAIHAGTGGVIAWTNPEGADIIVTRVILDLTTVSTGACTLDVGYTAVSATTTSDTLLDGIDANAAIGTFDSMNAALDAGANAKAQKAASGKWITIDEKTGDATGLVGTLYIEYFLA